MKRALLVLAFVPFLLSCVPASAQGPLGEGVINARWLHHVRGFANWDCSEPSPVGFVSVAMPEGSPAYRLTAAHERNHVAIMASFGSCDRWQRWSHSNRPLFEAMGFCAAIEEASRMGYDVGVVMGDAALALSRGYDFGLSIGEAGALIIAACKDPIYLAVTRRGIE